MLGCINRDGMYKSGEVISSVVFALVRPPLEIYVHFGAKKTWQIAESTNKNFRSEENMTYEEEMALFILVRKKIKEI